MADEQSHQTALRLGTAAGLGVACAYVLVRSLGLGYWTDLGPGPGFFPFWSAVIILVSLAGWLWNHFTPTRPEHDHDRILGLDADALESRLSGDPGRGETVVEETPIPVRWRLPVVVASLVVLALALEPFGFQLTMCAFLLFHLRFVGGTRWLVSLVVAAAGSFGVFVLFTEVFRVGLPAATIAVLRNLGL